MSSSNLLGREPGQPAPIQLPEDPAAAELASGSAPEDMARRYPTSSLAWATLAEQALDRGEDITGYAYARVGYHRGLDLLRRSGWRGAGPIPWSHEPNRGFLRSLAALGQAAALIDEQGEPERVRTFLLDSDPDIPAEMLP